MKMNNVAVVLLYISCTMAAMEPQERKIGTPLNPQEIRRFVPLTIRPQHGEIIAFPAGRTWCWGQVAQTGAPPTHVSVITEVNEGIAKGLVFQLAQLRKLPDLPSEK